MLPPALFNLHRLETSFDGAIPVDLLEPALAGDYAAYTCLLARRAERQFAQRILTNLQMISGWRMKTNPYRWHRLRMGSLAVQNLRQKACEAFDLCA